MWCVRVIENDTYSPIRLVLKLINQKISLKEDSEKFMALDMLRVVILSNL